MTVLLWILCFIGGGGLIAVIAAMCVTKHPLKALGKSAATGFLTLAAVNVTGGLTGVSLGLGWLSAGVCACLGLPGVALLLFLKTIFFA